MISVTATRASGPRFRIGYCQKHASAPFRPPVPADPHRDRRFCTSEPVGYDPSATLASDCSINRCYDPAGFLAGANPLREVELALCGDVAGKDLLNLQCHFGLDTLGWARLGARATGLDFSPAER